jgi:DivIVA domain-containing protein
MVDPQDIERVEFKATRLKEGYDQDEVDTFLDRVADTLRARNEQLNKANDEIVVLRRRVAELERRANDTPTAQLPVITDSPASVPVSESAAKLLELAQKTADDVVAQAQKNASDIIARADASAHDIVNEATKEADTRRRVAEGKAYQAEQHLAQLADTRNSVRAQLEAHLNDLHGKLGDPQ